MNKTRLFILAILCTALGAYGDVINKIVIESLTSQDVPEDVVRANIVLDDGAVFSQKRLSEDIKRLMKTGQFADVEAQVNPAGDGTVDITFKLRPRQRIAQINFKGNEAVKTRELRKTSESRVGDPMSGGILGEDQRSLIKLYRGKGFHGVDVRQNVKDIPGTNDVMVEYLIRENVRFKTRRLRIKGNNVYGTWKLKRVMDTGVSIWGYIFPTGYYSEEEFKNDLETLETLYWNKGYLDFKVDKVDKAVDKRSALVLLTIFLSEGVPFKVGTVSMDGNQIVSSEELAALVELQSNQVYSKSGETADIRRIVAKYNSMGHLDNRVYADRDIDRTAKVVNITYAIREGRASRINDINITGNRITKDHVIRRELQIHPRDLADGGKIEISKRRLMGLGYFESVEINPRSTDNPNLKDLEIKVKEQVTGRLSFGAGISSADSVIGLIEMSQANFDLRDPPAFRGGGQKLQLRLQAGTDRQNFNLAFTEPWLFHKQLRLDYNLWKRESSRNIGFTQKSAGTSFRVTRKMKVPFWRYHVGYRLEDTETVDFADDFSAEFVAAEGGAEMVSAVTLGFVRDQRDRLVLTSSGSRLAISGELQAEGIGSYINLTKIDVEADKYWPVFKESVFKLSGRVAAVNEASGDDARVWDRYFAGGSNTLRGFRERDVGPVDLGNEEPIGGKSLFLTTAEFTTPVFEKTIFWALFADAGNVWENSFDRLGDYNVGVGSGVRLMLPIGGIRLDYGFPVVRDQDHLSSGGRLHFDFGFNF